MKVQKSIEEKLVAGFNASVISVENESHMHSVPPNSETHFKVTLVSADFEGQMKVRRHQAIYKVLADELENTSQVRVNSLNPGGTRTSMRAMAYPAEDPASVPEAESIMPAYLYLMSPASIGTTGQALNARDLAETVIFVP